MQIELGNSLDGCIQPAVKSGSGTAIFVIEESNRLHDA